MDAYSAFLREFPAYTGTAALDRLRAEEYPRLGAGRHVYLDYTGAGLYAESQVRDHVALLAGNVLGNPHSGSLTSSAATALVEGARRRVLEWFNAPAHDYTAIFTPNATGAIKEVGEAYPFDAGSELLLSFDNHNSVNGVREFARRRGASVTYVPLTMPDLRMDDAALRARLASGDGEAPRLFAYPAQSNFSGVKHPLEYVALARRHGWDVLLDAAAYVPTNRLDLSEVQPDFVAVSFYKMFGYPTGVGCLIARRSTLDRLRRPWFAGGTVNFATVHGLAHILARGEAGYEDGTVNFLSIPAVTIGLDHLQRVGLDRVQQRLQALTGWTLRHLLELRHANGRHMVRIYGPADTVDRGATITFNLYD
ncbi:MAG: aminotransferase class V-fold PLP-dependent enzyme, partial [Vicinamibacterales bacterium]